MKILIVSLDTTLNGGIAKHVRQVSSNLGADVLIAGKVFQDPNVKFLLKVVGYPPLYFYNLWKYLRILHNYDSILVNDPQISTISLFTLILGQNKKLFFISHGLCFHNTNLLIIKKIYALISWRIVYKLGTIISISPSDDENLNSLGVKNFISNWHGVERKNKISTKKRDYYAVVVGRNVSHKNLNKFVDFVKLNQSLSHVLISDRSAVEYSETNLEVLHDLSDEQVTCVMSKSRYILSWSSYEGFGLAILEGVANGAIPIVLRNDSFSKIFVDTPEIIFEECTAESCYERIKVIENLNPNKLNNLKSRLEKIIMKHSIETQMKEFKRIINA